MTTLYVRSAERLSPRAQVRIEAANRRLLRRLRHPIRIEWDLSRDAGEWRVRSRVLSRSGQFVASARERTAAAAIDTLADAIVRQRGGLRSRDKARRRADKPPQPARDAQ